MGVRSDAACSGALQPTNWEVNSGESSFFPLSGWCSVSSVLIEPPVVQVEPHELLLLLESRSRQLEQWLYKVYSAANTQDAVTLTTGRACLSNLGLLIDQLLEQLQRLHGEQE